MSAPTPTLGENASAAPRVALAVVCLVAGAVVMGISPVFVRSADVGPFTSAFWRVALALPALWLWARLDQRKRGRIRTSAPWSWAVVLSGLFFAGDLLFWHLAIVHTTVANATFLATMAPVWVVLASGIVIREPVGRETIAGLALCLAGATLLIGMSYSVAPERLDGDLYGLVTSIFFGAYFLAVRVARRVASPGLLMFRGGLITAGVLFAVAVTLENQLFAASLGGLLALLTLALVTHVGGQGLLSFALGHLTAAFSSLVIFLEAVTAAIAGWLLLGEALSPYQAIGGAAILAGIFVARPRRSEPAASLVKKWPHSNGREC
ncbi:DMT family transporter [Amorphus sp. 3PC139-8]|uniref:DMT family transporter n=1 Tax=Amorphus sp. 3PC139-8 TaxID=2735676 RepID=UPI00345C9609